MPKRWWASITSKPLFMSVAESIVMRPPMSHVGCASASRGVISARSTRPRNGPPEAVTTRRSTVPGSAASISWYRAECSLSTGSRRAPVASASAMTSSPPTTRLSLLARATSIPSVSATIVGPSPAVPTIPFSTRSAPDEAISSRTPSSPAYTGSPCWPRASAAASGSAIATACTPCSRACSRARSHRAPAARPAISRVSERAMTSSACSPIDPVQPRIRTRLGIESSVGSGEGRSARVVYRPPPPLPSRVALDQDARELRPVAKRALRDSGLAGRLLDSGSGHGRSAGKLSLQPGGSGLQCRAVANFGGVGARTQPTGLSGKVSSARPGALVEEAARERVEVDVERVRLGDQAALMLGYVDCARPALADVPPLVDDVGQPERHPHEDGRFVEPLGDPDKLELAEVGLGAIQRAGWQLAERRDTPVQEPRGEIANLRRAAIDGLLERVGSDLPGPLVPGRALHVGVVMREHTLERIAEDRDVAGIAWEVSPKEAVGDVPDRHAAMEGSAARNPGNRLLGVTQVVAGIHQGPARMGLREHGLDRSTRRLRDVHEGDQGLCRRYELVPRLRNPDQASTLAR